MSGIGDDPGAGRSAGTAAGRAFVLLAVAVVLGVVLLNAADDRKPDDSVTASVVTSEDNGNSPAVTSTTITSTTLAPTRPHEQVKVLAANGTSSKGVAGKLTETLKGLGYNALAPVDATKAQTTVVYVAAGFEREGAELATLLALAPDAVKPLASPPPVPDVRGAGIVVVIGNDLASRIQSDSSSASTTTTAKKATTSTTAKP